MSAPPGRGPSTVTTIDADGVHELVAEMRLVSISEPAGLPKILGTRATIGTSELADVRIDDRTSSRLHCEITLEQGRARVRDLGSRNGTFVDGVEIQAAFLHDGATLRVGSHEFRFQIGQDRQRVPLYQPEKFGAMAGRSLAMRKIFAQLQQAAASDATVLLIGHWALHRPDSATHWFRDSCNGGCATDSAQMSSFASQPSRHIWLGILGGACGAPQAENVIITERIRIDVRAFVMLLLSFLRWSPVRGRS
jgi:hypothetical protein